MARHALNLVEPANWRLTERGREYVSPSEEAQHLANLQARQAAQTLEVAIQASIQAALEDAERSSPQLLEQAVASAQRLSTMADTSEDARHSRITVIIPTAMILARDGADALLNQHEDWARQVFAQAFASTDHVPVSRWRDGIRFNPVAIATLGVIHLWRRRGRDTDLATLFELAGKDDHYAAQGFGAGLTTLRNANSRLLPALLRCALVAQIRPTQNWDDPDEQKAANQAQQRERVSAAIRAEVDWLDGVGPEPGWPTLPSVMISVRHGLKIGDGGHRAQPAQTRRPSEQFRWQNAAPWIRQLTHGCGAADLTWLVGFVNAYADWTAEANGGELGADAEIDNRLEEWNSVFFPLVASAITRMAPNEAVAYVRRMAAVPDSSFFDITSELVPAIDRVHFDGLGLEQDMALTLRTLLVERLMQSYGWRRERDRSELRVEIGIGSAIAALFFNNYDLVGGASCYLTEKGFDQIGPFLPTLKILIEHGPVPFTAILTMNLLEVSPRADHTAFLLSSALIWLRREPTNTPLWVDKGLGARVARWLEGIVGIDPALRSPDHPLRLEADVVLACLVQVGVGEAHRVEGLFAGTSDPAS